MVELTCISCTDSKMVPDVVISKGREMDAWAWFLSVGQRCTRCRSQRLPDPSVPQMKLAIDARDTSILAADLVLPRSGSQRLRVLEAIANAPHGLTDPEVEVATGLQANSERPRRLELVERGWVRDSGLRRPTSHHGQSIVWVVTTEAAVRLFSESLSVR